MERYLSPEDPLFLGYKCISKPETVYVVDQNSFEPHLVVRMTPFSGIGRKDKKDFEAVFSHMADNSTFKYNITQNGAMIDGKMVGLHWRVRYDTGMSMKTYAVVLDTQDRNEKCKRLKNKEKDIDNIYRELFCSLASTLCENTTNYRDKNSLPYMGVCYDERLPQTTNNYLFVSNLTYTISMFIRSTLSRILTTIVDRKLSRRRTLRLRR